MHLWIYERSTIHHWTEHQAVIYLHKWHVLPRLYICETWTTAETLSMRLDSFDMVSPENPMILYTESPPWTMHTATVPGCRFQEIQTERLRTHPANEDRWRSPRRT